MANPLTRALYSILKFNRILVKRHVPSGILVGLIRPFSESGQNNKSLCSQAVFSNDQWERVRET